MHRDVTEPDATRVGARTAILVALQNALTNSSDGRIRVQASVGTLQSFCDVVEQNEWTIADLEAVGRLARDGRLRALARNGRKSITFTDLHGFNRDWAPLVDAMVLAREGGREEPGDDTPPHLGLVSDPYVGMSADARARIQTRLRDAAAPHDTNPFSFKPPTPAPEENPDATA